MDIRSRYVFDLTNAIYYTVVQGDTLDGIAYRQYGNAQLWWAIMDANPQYQSELEIKAGDVLCIPPYEQVVRVSE
jgi:nucleoid-associated protein YgaU